MKYMILIYGSQQDYDGMAGKRQRRAGLDAGGLRRDGRRSWTRFNAELEESGELVETRASRRRCTPAGFSCRTASRRHRRPYAETAGGARRLLDRRVRRASTGPTEIAARLADCPAPEHVAATAVRRRPADHRVGRRPRRHVT